MPVAPLPVQRMPRAVRRFRVAAVLSAAALLAGCPSIKESKPMAEALSQGVRLERSLPKALPEKSSSAPHSQFVLIRSENAAELASPIPFVADIVTSAVHKKDAEAYEAQYARVDPFRIVADVMKGSPVLAKAAGGVPMQPFAFVQECVDARYRISLVGHVESGDHLGRYFIHLADLFTPDEIRKPTPPVLDRMESDLRAAAAQLRTLLERAARRELQPSGVRVDVGSLHLVGGRAIGLVPPTLQHAKNADLIEEGPDHVLVRIDGDPSKAASVGGLMFGVHWLRKDQLHTFEKRPAGS